MHFEVAPNRRSDAGGPQGTQIASLGLPPGVASDVPSGIIPAAAPLPGTPRAPFPPPVASPQGGMNLEGIRQNSYPTDQPPGYIKSVEQDQQAYRNAQMQVAPMALNNTQYKEAHDAIARLAQHDITSGPGQAALLQARRLLNQFGIGNADTVNDAVTAEKLLSKAILNTAPRSDQAQSLTQLANPSVHMEAGASLPIIRQLVAGNRAQQLAVETAPDKQGNGFIAHNTDKSRTYNSPEGLAALSFDMTPKAQRDAYYQNLKKMDAAGNHGPLQRFTETFEAAHDKKVLAP
jgi:hypothetical protein